MSIVVNEMNHPSSLITAASALRRIPPHIDPADKVVFDGIRFSLEILDRAHRGLRESLWALSQQEQIDPVDIYVAVLADAWQMVDCLNRLATFFDGSSSYLDHDFCREYANLLAHVALPRNAIQHVRSRQEKIIADKEPVWGILGWASCVGSLPDLNAHIYCFAPGTIRNSELPVTELPERPFYPPHRRHRTAFRQNRCASQRADAINGGFCPTARRRTCQIVSGAY